jgi:hypothetical protein
MNDSNPYETDDLKEYKRLVFLKRTFVPTESGKRADLCVLRSDLVFLPVGSPHLNPIEPVWKSLKLESSPLIVDGGDEYRTLLEDLFDQLTEKPSFAASWIDNYLSNFLNKLTYYYSSVACQKSSIFEHASAASLGATE